MRLFLAPALIVAALGLFPAQAAAPSRGALERAVDDYVAPLVETNNFAGVILIARDDRIVFQKGYGLADIEHGVANTPSTVFHVASVSKPFTAAAIMRLVEDGKIDVRAPLTRILPEYPNGDRLTVHHLLTHTSGIPNINDFPEYEAIQWTPHTPPELVDIFKERPLEFEPGARYRYSNSNYNLLALIIEKISGKPYGRFLQDEIFAPLGLEHTGHPRDMAEIVPGLANGYAPAGALDLERARYIDWSVKTGNGSLYMTAGDLHEFIRAVHRGKLLNADSLAATFTEHTPNVGYGWFLTSANNRRLHHINGRQPGWAAQADYYADDGVTVVVLSNLYISVTTPMARAIGAIYFGEPFEKMPALSAKPLPRDAIAPLLGKYQFGPDYYVPNQINSMVERDGNLFAEYTPYYRPSAFIPVTPTTFIIRPFWVTAEFRLGGDGRAAELVIDGRFAGKRVE